MDFILKLTLVNYILSKKDKFTINQNPNKVIGNKYSKFKNEFCVKPKLNKRKDLLDEQHLQWPV